MKNIEYNAITGEEIITEVPDIPLIEVEIEPSLEDVVCDLITILADKGVIY